MAFYNLMKKADRAQYRADAEAELKAAEDGSWPRDLNDEMRWMNAPTNPYGTAEDNMKVCREYAARMCRSAIEYIDGLEARIAAKDPDLAYHEA